MCVLLSGIFGTIETIMSEPAIMSKSGSSPEGIFVSEVGGFSNLQVCLLVEQLGSRFRKQDGCRTAMTVQMTFLPSPVSSFSNKLVADDWYKKHAFRHHECFRIATVLSEGILRSLMSQKF